MIKITINIENIGDKIWFCKNECFEDTINRARDEVKSIIKDDEGGD